MIALQKIRHNGVRPADRKPIYLDITNHAFPVAELMHDIVEAPRFYLHVGQGAAVSE
jgi:hypothetical protein